MNQEKWTAVDDYFNDLLIGSDPALDAALRDSAAAGLPAINVTALQGKLLMMLAKIAGAKNILEIGTLGGYSTIWLARALPVGGRVITLEYQEKHAKTAAKNIARAGLSNVIEIIIGSAMQSLPKLAADGRGPFDLIFIDADKVNTADYFRWSLKLARPGTIIVIDNVVRKGAVIDPKSSDADVQGIRKFNEVLAAEKSVTSTALQTVCAKGYDGFAIATVN